MSDGQDVLGALRAAHARGFHLHDGLGGHAAGTAAGAPATRAQVLLALPGAAGPQARVLRFDDRLTRGGLSQELSAAFLISRSGGLTHRAGGTLALEHFESGPVATWRWRFDDLVLERRIRLLEGHLALMATWRLLEGSDVRLTVAPLLVSRALHALQREDPAFRGASQGIPGRVRLECAEGDAPLTLWHNGVFLPARSWHRGLAYPIESASEDGDPALAALASEDACVPGWVQADLAAPGAALHVVISPEEHLFRTLAAEERLGSPPARSMDACLTALDAAAIQRREGWRRFAMTGAEFTARQAAVAHGGPGEARARDLQPLLDPRHPWAAALASRLHLALTRRDGRLTLAAGADGIEHGAPTLRAASAFVSLRAFETARAIARGYLEYLDEGLAPEAFAADGRPLHGGPEASLWLIHLVELLARRDAEGSERFLRETAWPALEGMMHHLRSGSRSGVHCDREGLLWYGEGDAAVARADWNALWYHGLVALAQLAKRTGHREHAAFSLAWAHELQRRYVEAFWDERTQGLVLALGARGRTRGVTPSALWAAALPPALLAPDRARALLATLERELGTARGFLPRPGEGEPDAAWLAPWAAAHQRASSRDARSTARVRERFDRLAERVDVQAMPAVTAGALLVAWIEDLDHASDPAPLAAAARG